MGIISFSSLELDFVFTSRKSWVVFRCVGVVGDGCDSNVAFALEVGDPFP